MLRERREAAQAVADSLFANENDNDVGIANAAALLIALVEARKAFNLSTVIGQAAFEHAGRALSAHIDARRELVAVHGVCAELKTQLRMDGWDLGTGGGKPALAEGGPLRIIAASV